ncbi:MULTISPECIES: hypothetical protein [Glycomyces]|uniref:Uncharacterized protein n=2 Tax=Glycomyces TaxID=58113 RepID=A0A9X3STV6_9ACTN|nr:hypothetical protein [Glycomyces lechevalierae]MDA1384209.1 hypothetical protein [Glycomyces lechevalierae]MDR7339361.1 hypothetical protein [Glycomyces lechevalierae]
MAIPEPLGLTRRTVLTGAAALLAAGSAGLTVPRPADAAGLPQIRAAAAGWTGRNGELLVLTADPATEDDYAVRLLTPTENPATGAELGPPLPLSLPAGFHPHSMAALGDTLWMTGAVELGPDRARPALVRVRESAASYAPLPLPKTIRSGIATAVAPLGERGLAVAVEGCSDPHLAVITRAHLAVTANAGRSWTDRPLATGLGEGYGTVLAGTAGGLFAVVANGEGAQTIRTGHRLARAMTLADAGRPMAAVAAPDHVSVFSDHHGTVTETRFTHAGAPLEAAPACACRGEILAVPGRPGTWLETDGQTIHIRDMS